MGHLAARWKVTVPSVDVSFGRATEWFADFTDGMNRALRCHLHPVARAVGVSPFEPVYEDAESRPAARAFARLRGTARPAPRSVAAFVADVMARAGAGLQRRLDWTSPD